MPPIPTLVVNPRQPDETKCLTPDCGKLRAANCRGLCMKCKGRANRLVESGQTTWDELEAMGLAEPVGGSDKFLEAFRKRSKE